MINIKASSLGRILRFTPARRWKGKLYCHSGVLILYSPKRTAMSFDDGSTD